MGAVEPSIQVCSGSDTVVFCDAVCVRCIVGVSGVNGEKSEGLSGDSVVGGRSTELSVYHRP